jgi:CubicO group peptidase (beta-lactamase class C family)
VKENTMKRVQQCLWVIICVLVPLAAWAGSIPTVAPEEVGLSSEGLARIDAAMQQLVDDQRVAGVVALIARRGKIAYFETFGMRDVEAGKPMEKDTIFRIYSMTKPITSVAVMMLYEEGRFSLDDPVSKYMPELGGLEVGVEGKDPETGQPTFTTVPSERDMTVRDLLRHTAGLTYGLFAQSEVDRMYIKAGVLNRSNTVADMVEQLGKLPLKHQPGTVWEYSVATDVLGRFVEVISGMPFDTFLENRILKPLEMNDTAFYVPQKKKNRFAALYTQSRDKTIQPNTSRAYQDFVVPPTFLSGGGGLVSTTTDYLRFCQMLLNKGTLDGVRLLKPETVQLMTTDQLGDVKIAPIGVVLGVANAGFGLGFRITKTPGRIGSLGSEGTYGWGGAASTIFWIDPKEQMIGIFMVQITPLNSTYGNKFAALVYEALEE